MEDDTTPLDASEFPVPYEEEIQLLEFLEEFPINADETIAPNLNEQNDLPERKRQADSYSDNLEPVTKRTLVSTMFDDDIVSSANSFSDEKKGQDECSDTAAYGIKRELDYDVGLDQWHEPAIQVPEAARGTFLSSTGLDDSKKGQRLYSGIFSSPVDDEENKTIPDYDVVLGHSHTPTMGTRVWRDVRRSHAKRSIADKTLSELKAELRQNLEASIEKRLPRNPLFWYSATNTKKLDPDSKERRVLKGGSGCLFGIATDKAIKQDVKNAPKKDRSRSTNAFNLEGTPEQVSTQAKAELEAWVGNDSTKRLVAEGFKENLVRLEKWRDEYDKKKTESEQMGTERLHEALIHEIHVEQLNERFASQANQFANDMVERYERLKRKLGESGRKQLESKGAPGTACKSEFDTRS